jgi:hypothetical protein
MLQLHKNCVFYFTLFVNVQPQRHEDTKDYNIIFLIHRLPGTIFRSYGAGADYPDEIEKENAFHRAGTEFRELLGYILTLVWIAHDRNKLHGPSSCLSALVAKLLIISGQ